MVMMNRALMKPKLLKPLSRNISEAQFLGQWINSAKAIQQDTVSNLISCTGTHLLIPERIYG